jgi:hypothetical protein
MLTGAAGAEAAAARAEEHRLELARIAKRPAAPAHQGDELLPTAGTAVVVVFPVMATMRAAPLGCRRCTMHVGFLSSMYPDASTIYRDSQSVKVISDVSASIPQ